MKKTAQMIRCVPRCGFEHTEVRAIDLDLTHSADERELRQALYYYFASRGINDAIYDIAVDDNGYFAVINDEAYAARWGKPLL